MTLETLERESHKPWLIVTTPSAQRAIMQQHRFNPPRMVTYLTLKDLFEKVFFAYQPGALKAAQQFLKTTPEIAKRYLSFLPWLKAPLNDSMTTKMWALKKFLTEQALLKQWPQKQAYFARYDVLFYGDIHDPLIERCAEPLRAFTKVYKVPLKEAKQKRTLGSFDTLDEEIYAALTAVREALDMGASLEDCVLYAPSSHHHLRIRLEAPHFGIPLECSKVHPLTHYPRIKTFVEQVSHASSGSLYDTFESALKATFPSLNAQTTSIYKRLLNVLHTYLLEANDTLDIELLEYYLAQETLTLPASKRGVKLIQNPNLSPSETTQLFVVGAHDNALVHHASDDDLLPDRQKERLGMPTTWEVNLAREETTEAWLKSFPNLWLSWAQKSMLERFEKSPLFERLMTKDATLINTRSLAQPYSITSDQLEAKMAYETFKAYGTKTEALRLASQHQSILKDHDTQFKGLSKKTLERLLPETIHLSYTSLNTLFQCHFAYFCERILSLKPYEQSFAMSMGTLMHALLEHHLNEPELTDHHFEAALNTMPEYAQWSASQKASTKRQFAWMKDVFKTIQAQHAHTLFVLKETEKRLSYPLPKHPGVIFRGVIDKIMEAKIQGVTHALIVDYKTGKPQLDDKKAVYGLNAQLIYYAYILKQINHTVDVVGFYEQTLMPNQKFNYEKHSFEKQFEDYLRWQGFSTHDQGVLSVIDPGYQKSSLIKGMSVTREQKFNVHTKWFDEAGLAQAFKHVERQLDEAVNIIREGTFEINPYTDEKGNLLPCAYCAFNDLCYKKPAHYRALPKGPSIFDVEEPS